MKTRFLEVWGKIKEGFSGLSSGIRKMIIFGSVAVVGVLIVAAIVLSNRPYEVLFTGLNDQEQAEIIGKLQESEVSFRLEQNGTILVPREQEQRLKAQLVYEGYPKSGFTYDVFQNSISMMSTDFEKERYDIFQLQERMGATISLFDGVESAVVTIAPAEEQKYVLGNNANLTEASASVTIVMKNAGEPTQAQILAAQRLVSKSVKNLPMENVAVIDGNGNDLTPDSGQSASGLNRLKLELEEEIETIVERKVLNVLAPIYGEENINISVRANMDIDKKIREIIQYEAPPNEEDKRGIPSNISNEQEIVRGSDTVGGVVGTETNSDVPIYNTVTEADGTESYIRNQNNVDYLVNQVKEQAQSDAGSLADLTVSVTINGNNLGNLTRAEVLDLTAKASGISPDMQEEKIAVVATPFYQPPVEIPPEDEMGEGEGDGAQGGLNRWIIIGAAAFGIILLLLILILLLVRRRRKKKLSSMRASEPATPAEALSEALAGIESGEAGRKRDDAYGLLSLDNERGMELKENIREFVAQNPEVSASLLKSWLKGGEE